MDETRRAIISIGAGVLYVAVIVANALALGIPDWEYASVFTVGYPLLGMFFFGAASVYSLIRLGLVTPALLTGLFTAASFADHVVPGLHYFTTFYAALWVPLAGGVAVVGIVEYLIRKELDVFPPRPVVWPV